LSISPKLQSVSGEKGAVNVSNIMQLFIAAYGQLKFVVDASDACEQELFQVVKLLNEQGYDGEYWVMPLGETRDDQLNIAPIVEKYQELGFKIALRGHTYVTSIHLAIKVVLDSSIDMARACQF
jgi:hypothetical protein